ncbi:hypothetical protein CCACVL1_28452 [Corchorus capsularis]|uniref:Uncharacterized protein n=1 Tax=Corchorus capsularis TaxID=210143 RepID=A0A1R3G6E6_COCAP|nr:hypothetical protein CCACVL1_28452 [Corchorus capsularis]
MENKVAVEGISGGFDDSGEIQNAPNVRSSDIYSLRDYDSGSDQNEAPLLPGTSDSSVISTSHWEPLSGWSLGPGHQLAQESWGASSDSSFEVIREFYNTASILLKGKTDIPKKQGVLSVRAASMLRDEVQRRGVYKGQCQGGLPEGKGRLVLGDGSIYDGRRYGKRSGVGTFYFSNGDVFQGSWRDDLMHGKGKANGEGRFYSKSGKVFFGHCINVDGARCIEIWDEGVLTLPVELSLLPVLENLYLDNNKLSVVPPELGELKTLKLLVVEYSMLVSVPVFFGLMSSPLGWQNYGRVTNSMVNILNKNSEEVEKVMQEFKGMHFKDPQIDLTNVLHDAFFKYLTKPKLTSHGYPKDNMALMYFQLRSCDVSSSCYNASNIGQTRVLLVGILDDLWKKLREDQVDKGKRGIDKQPFQLTDFSATGIEKIIQILHDAFFKYRSRSQVLQLTGIFYHEGKQFELSPIGTEHFPVAARISFLSRHNRTLGLVRRHYPPLSTQPLDRSALGVPNSAESEKPASSAPAPASVLHGQFCLLLLSLYWRSDEAELLVPRIFLWQRGVRNDRNGSCLLVFVSGLASLQRPLSSRVASCLASPHCGGLCLLVSGFASLRRPLSSRVWLRLTAEASVFSCLASPHCGGLCLLV